MIVIPRSWTPETSDRIDSAVASLAKHLDVQPWVGDITRVAGASLDLFKARVNGARQIHSPAGDVVIGEIRGVVFSGRQLPGSLEIRVFGVEDLDNAWRCQRTHELRRIINACLDQYTRDEIVAVLP